MITMFVLSMLCYCGYFYYSKLPSKSKEMTNSMAFILSTIIVISLWVGFFFGLTIGVSILVFLIGLTLGLMMFAMSNGEWMAIVICVGLSWIVVGLIWVGKWIICESTTLCL